MPRPKFSGLSKNGNLHEAIDAAVAAAKNTLQTDFVQWRLAELTGEYGGFTHQEHLTAVIEVLNAPTAFRFEDSDGQSFVAISSDSAVLARCRSELDLPLGQRSLHINGAIAAGDGGHNSPWNWHFQADQWDLVQISMELCDGTCQIVEKDIDYWLNDVGSFCPWAARVVEEL